MTPAEILCDERTQAAFAATMPRRRDGLAGDMFVPPPAKHFRHLGRMSHYSSREEESAKGGRQLEGLRYERAMRFCQTHIDGWSEA